jgi:hypothetical protein
LSCSAAAKTLRRVSSLTEGFPESARETVGWDTPAIAAMSNEVGRLCIIEAKS